ncbi:ATP-binding protein [Krasilnikoviella flava]|uniref:Transcriptional activator domain-containing protein n=1 Tax=Krasilnikoviella flava TaxID=526729 RepID=A0A1T5ISC3_9MICO|nr:AAA family ATPase [Krasilnikoviella flava]SKC42071.1 transcriptional activator domain-containing protein [Krasilnikoviella flava]
MTAPLLRLHLLGGFRVTRDGGPELPERWPRPSARTLVKLLAVAGDHRLHREQATDVCWPDADPSAAVGSLRVALHAARHALEPELPSRAASSYLVSDGAMLQLDPATVWIDADHAEAAAREALASGARSDLAAALGLFTGELLPEDRFAAWAQSRRERTGALRDRVRLALAAAHLAAGDVADAVATAEDVLADSPAEELAHRVLIEAFLRQGLRRRAVYQYHACREALDTELGVRPGHETERLHQLALDVSSGSTPTGAALPAPLRIPAATPLRGRDAELGRLLGGIGSDGGPPVHLLTGEAGIGKTRLVAEVAWRAAADGAAVLWGGGHDAEGHTPYGAFAEALDGWLAEQDADSRARVGAEHPDLVAFLPSLGRADTHGRSPEEERDRLFRATAALLGDLAAARPVVLVLDDLHAADAGSFQLLGHLARRTARAGVPLRFLVTLRPEELPEGDPRRVGLTSLERGGLAVREEVERLDRDACLAVAADAAGDAAGADRLRRVWELSLGNPLFAAELARGLGDAPADAGSPDEPGRPDVLRGGDVAPHGVRQLVAERLGRLDDDTRRVIEALSAAGGEAPLTELLDVAATGLNPPLAGAEAADAVERALAASLVEERTVVVDGRAETGLAFRHPLVRLTCYDRLSGVRRGRLHVAFAQTVLRRRPEAVDVLASHFARTDDPRAAEYLRRAAERAAALYANDSADQYYRDLVARLDVDAARARLDHGQVLRRMGQFEEAAAVLRPALGEFVRRGDHEHAVLAAARLAEMLVRTGDPGRGAELLRAHPPDDSTSPEQAAAHHVAWSALLRMQGRHDDGLAAADRALAEAGRVGGATGQGLVARAHALRATHFGMAGRIGEAAAAAAAALPHAEAYGDPTLLGSILSTQRENARRGGRLREAVGIGRRALDLVAQSGDPVLTAFERANLAEIHLLLGEVDEARGLAQEAAAGAEGEATWVLPYALAALGRVQTATGEVEDAEHLLHRAVESAARLADRQAQQEASIALAEAVLRAGRPADALRALEDAGAGAPALTAWCALGAGDPGRALEVSAAGVARARAAGERLAEVDAQVAHAAALHGTGEPARGDAVLDEAGDLARDLPYPAGVTAVAEARTRWGRSA